MSSGCRKSLFRTSMTWILLRLTRSTSCNFSSSCFTISLLGWLVKTVIWNPNQSMKKLLLPQFSLERWRCWAALMMLSRNLAEIAHLFKSRFISNFFELWLTFKPIWNGLRGSLEEHPRVLFSVLCTCDHWVCVRRDLYINYSSNCLNLAFFLESWMGVLYFLTYTVYLKDISKVSSSRCDFHHPVLIWYRERETKIQLTLHKKMLVIGEGNCNHLSISSRKRPLWKLFFLAFCKGKTPSCLSVIRACPCSMSYIPLQREVQ